MKLTNLLLKTTLLLLAPALVQANTVQNCLAAPTSLAPFYSSSVTGNTWETFNFITPGLRNVYGKSEDITTENFRDAQRNAKQRVSRNTLVKIEDDFYKANKDAGIILDKILNSDAVVNKYIPVKVITPETIYSRLKSARAQALFVKEGDKGLIISESLVALDEKSVLIANEDITLENLELIPKGSLLFPVIATNNKGAKYYNSYHCKDSNKLLYPFVIQPPDKSRKNNSEKIVYLNIKVDGKGFSPIRAEDVANLKKVQNTFKNLYKQDINLADLEVDYKGFIRMPMTNETQTLQISAYSYDNSFVHYQGGDPMTSDTWGTANTLCAMMKFGADWKSKCQGDGCVIQMGDIAFATRATNHKNKKIDALGHKTHNTGKCIDFRVLRKDNLLTGATIYDKNYDRQKTTDFLNLAQEHGADVSIFGDRKVTRNMTDVTQDADHRDHTHICFPDESVKNYCD